MRGGVLYVMHTLAQGVGDVGGLQGGPLYAGQVQGWTVAANNYTENGDFLMSIKKYPKSFTFDQV